MGDRSVALRSHHFPSLSTVRLQRAAWERLRRPEGAASNAAGGALSGEGLSYGDGPYASAGGGTQWANEATCRRKGGASPSARCTGRAPRCPSAASAATSRTLPTKLLRMFPMERGINQGSLLRQNSPSLHCTQGGSKTRQRAASQRPTHRHTSEALYTRNSDHNIGRPAPCHKRGAGGWGGSYALSSLGRMLHLTLLHDGARASTREGRYRQLLTCR